MIKVILLSKSFNVRDYIKAMRLEITIMGNMYNGKDTHIRGLKIFGPRIHMSHDLNNPYFSTLEFQQFKTLR